MIDDTVTVPYRQILAEFTLKHHVAAVMARREFAEAGGGGTLSMMVEVCNPEGTEG